MNKLILVISVLISASCLSGCSRDENDDLTNGKSNETTSNAVSIVGTWELKTICYPDGSTDIPLGQRDIFIFSLNGKVNVTKKRKSSLPNFPNEDGEYDYFYDKEKQTLLLCGKTRECIIKDSIMNLESGYVSDRGEPIQNFIFIKKHI